MDEPEIIKEAIEEVEAALDPKIKRDAHIAELIAVIKESADKLLADGSSRGDLKLLSRTIRELRYGFKVFAPYRNRRKATIFGSARTQPHEPAYEQAVKCGRAFAEHDWLVITGAASGIMEAGHEGAGRAHSMGLNIMLPFEQGANPVIAGDSKLVNMKYFFTRKLMFVKECDAVVCCPGGFGTMDEFMEVLTLLQTGKRDMIPIVLLNPPGSDYWQSLQDFVRKQLFANRLISEEDFALYKLTDDHQVAVDEVMNFFKVYHSMRYVKQKLVLRLKSPISAELLDAINVEFKSILSEGKFEQGGPLPAEQDEVEFAEMPRLIFTFNRRNQGKLRTLIDAINRGKV